MTTIHVHDASRAVGVVSKLLDHDQKAAELAEDNRALAGCSCGKTYGRRDRKPLLSYDDGARQPSDRSTGAPRTSPGRHVVGRQPDSATFPLEEIVPYIDWTFFFTAWELKGRFPQGPRSPAIR